MAQGFTSFDVDDDFEGGVFGADGEFYAKSQKERKKLSKNEQIYGIFFDGADSPKAKSKKDTGFGANTSFGAAPAAPKSYMNFVKSDKILYNPEAGKVKVNFGKKKKPATEEKPAEAEEEGEPRKKTVKFNEARNTEMLFDKKKPASAVPDFIESDEEAQEEEDQINIKISKKLQDRKQKFDLKKHNQESDILGVPNEFGKRRRPAAAAAAPTKKTTKEENMEADMEEKYGKGWKLMQKMDYKVNTGLGSKEQGRIDPIKAVKKTVLDGSKVGDAFDKGKSRGAADDLLNDLEDEEMEPRKADQPKMWKKGKAHEQQKYLRRTAHVRAHDITVPEKEVLKPVVQQKIIDMTGAEVKYYEDYTAMKIIGQPKPAATMTVSYAKPKFLSEMLLTVKGNVDKAKYNIQSFERKIKIEKDKVVNYNYEKQQRAEEQQKLDKNIQNLKVLSLKLQQFKTQADTFNADETIQLFNDCFTATPEQFVYLKLDSLFIVTVIKKVQAEVSSWKIRSDTLEANYGLYTRVKNFLIKILQYKEYLKYKSYTEKSVESIFKGTDNYDTTLLEKYLTELFNQTWTYPVKTYVINEWIPSKDLDTPLIPLLEKWKSILPPIVLTQMYDGVIMPKLQKAVDEWTPTSDPMPVHIWLHPWFPLLGQARLETLWKSIQLKISQLLKSWQPQDKSALVLLKPWLKVFDAVSWENLIVRCILPKVLYALTDFEINPKKQEVGPIRWMLDWADYIPQDTLVQTLENYVLRKIVEVGIEWINTPGSKKEEIKGWIMGWKDLLGQKIMSLPAVQHYFRSLENIIR